MDTSLIYFDDNHISAAQLAMPPIPEIHGYLQEARFFHASRMQGGCKLNLTLTDALVERWRSETHTFHIPCGECTITLEDIALQLGLPVDRPVIIGSAMVRGKVDLCTAMLGKILNRGILMPDKSRNLVHVRWLLHLVDFSECAKLSWGSVVLSILYRELCRATQLDKMPIGGCLLLLQSWA
ncbi:hypothetical protein Gotur_001060 [Gossypium turneri]